MAKKQIYFTCFSLVARSHSHEMLRQQTVDLAGSREFWGSAKTASDRIKALAQLLSAF